jgi:hypothetical protein
MRDLMRRFNAFLLVAWIAIVPAHLAGSGARRTSSGSRSSRSSTSRRAASAPRSAPRTTKQRQHVSSYKRKNGTTVQAYQRAPAGMGAMRSTAGRGLALTRTPSVRSSAPSRAVQRRSTVARAPAAGTAPRDAKGRIARSAAAKDGFKKAHPCPATGKSSGPCPGYVIDHVQALKHGGADAPSNMQWQTVAAAKAKDKVE